MVDSLRHRHATLLRPREPPSASAAAVAANQAGLVHDKKGSADTRSYTTVPVRLITNGFWPAAAAGQVLGSCCPTVDVSGSAGTPAAAVAAARFQGRGRREGDASGGDKGKIGSVVVAPTAQRNSQSVPSWSGPAERGSPNPEADASAASVASEIAELFDSVSVALNTADPLQYEEVSGCS